MPVLSKVSTSPAIPSSTALILANKFLHPVFDCSLRNSNILSYMPSHLDFIPVINFGSLSYHLKPELASTLWLKLIQRARIILYTVNDFHHLLALQQLDISWPVIGLSYLLPGHNPLLDVSLWGTLFTTFHAMQHAAHWYSNWIFNAVKHTVSLSLSDQHLSGILGHTLGIGRTSF